MAAAQSELTRARARSAWLFLAPMLVVLALTAAWPLARTIFFSFTDDKLGDASYHFVGFDNYFVQGDGYTDGILADPLWLSAVWHTVWFAVVSVALETALGLVVALVLNSDFRGRALVRTAILVPWAIPTVVSSKMWAWMLNDQLGIVNDMLQRAHLISGPVAWTANPSVSMISVIFVDVWKTTPFMALMILAALQLLPTDCYEAGRIDGVSPVKMFFKVTLPLIWPALIVAIVFRALDALRVFDLIYLLTSGSNDTISMSVYAQQQLVQFQKVGVGSAASTLLFIVLAIFTAGTLLLTRSKNAEA
ncbi:MAG: sugar ABC transporter permease [Hyphomicrobiales bacterium]|nr:sugar ABC transporter permease [Hyphomicrobiales bacterium]MDE2017294.1 sugar ABC transporter permease [Hyphomicrobiales bacterium]